ncbi:malonyl-CoA:anthocyanidin 5-O-glucoside-6''-O-malonyltransferase [Cucumis melo var. makuwa]|uniref:Malonyl-CoA:anthocyanidin 5-O-glucoside-6''-O-malonyltransferase n=1 Tax=Cucumis melo var. makuwa TaxID=1194695 RepID=A0A5A7TDC4_CUCMM|nr:malonyl-CoA:anthocyanidin 5-O-glucoside-6''-O-malonyltransferase [Cucumis melo var. makuwa]TYK00624.1 malonyl-CoA:anthocyanidin 5-O-glucoside-6''-O-malonyltransferase [Cucumis melo var. makuwa]
MEKLKPNLISILEVSTVAPPPASPSSPTHFSLPFTYFDALFLKIPPTERIFFYSLPDPPLFNSNSLLTHLKHSLSLTLQHFLPLAGNLVWPPESPKPIVRYSPGDGVSLTVVETDADFTHFSGTGIRPVEECRPFVPELPAADDSVPVMALQITLFQNRGLSIGISNHHAFVDGKSSIMFLKSWAYIFKQTLNKPESSIALPPELTPFFDRSIIKDPKGIDMLYINYWLKKTNPTDPSIKSLKYFPNLGVPPEMVRGTFKFTRTDIENLRKATTKEDESKPSKPTRYSSFVLAFAYISICAVKSARIEQKNKRVYLGFYADWRARLDPAVPANYFGNCGGSHGVFAEVGELEDEEKGLGIASKRIDEAIKGLDENVTKGAEESLSKWEKVEEGIKFVGVVGSPRLGVYELDFGWGRPENVKMVSIERTGSISLADGRDGDGIEVSLVLSQPEMLCFASIFSDGLKTL